MELVGGVEGQGGGERADCGGDGGELRKEAQIPVCVVFEDEGCGYVGVDYAALCQFGLGKILMVDWLYRGGEGGLNYC